MADSGEEGEQETTHTPTVCPRSMPASAQYEDVEKDYT